MSGLGVDLGGTTQVLTEELLRLALRIDEAGGRLHDHVTALALLPLVADVSGAHDGGLDAPRHLLQTAAHDAQALAAELRRAAAEYADGERDVGRCVGTASSVADRMAGRSGGSAEGSGMPLWLRTAVDASVLLDVGALAAWHPEGRTARALPTAVRHVVSDAAASASRLLPGRAPGDDGTREATGALLAVLGAAGLLRDAPAVVRRLPDRLRPAPAGIADLAARIPDPLPEAPQMRVEEYRTPGGARRFVAYVGGMQTLSAGTTREDFGPASAAAALATERGSAVRAAERALHDAGVVADDEVYLVGYSMGGIVARSVGDDPAFHVTHELTFGSPLGQLPLREGIEGVAVEHVDDPVPQLGGERTADGDGGDDVVVRSRSADDAGRGRPADALAAHQLPTYRATAEQMDASRAPRLRAAHDELRAFLDGGTMVASHLYRAEREAPVHVPVPVPAPVRIPPPLPDPVPARSR